MKEKIKLAFFNQSAGKRLFYKIFFVFLFYLSCFFDFVDGFSLAVNFLERNLLHIEFKIFRKRKENFLAVFSASVDENWNFLESFGEIEGLNICIYNGDLILRFESEEIKLKAKINSNFELILEELYAESNFYLETTQDLFFVGKINVKNISVNAKNILNKENGFILAGGFEVNSGDAFINEGKIFLQKDFALRAEEFTNTGVLSTLGKFDLQLVKYFLNSSGQIWSRGDLYILALEDLYNIRPGPRKHWGRTIEASNEFGWDYCNEFEEWEDFSSALLISTQGKIYLYSKRIKNEASAIIAKNGIKFDFLRLENKIHTLKKNQCKIKSRKVKKKFLFFTTSKKYYQDLEEIISVKASTNAVIASDNGYIDFEVRNTKKDTQKDIKLNKKRKYSCKNLREEACNIDPITSRVINQGQIFNFNGDIKLSTKEIFKFLNGNNFCCNNLEVSDFETILRFFMESGGYEIVPKNSLSLFEASAFGGKFLYRHPLLVYSDGSLTNILRSREINEVVFITGLSDKMSGKCRWQADPMVEAEVLTKSLFASFQSAFISGYSSIYHQLEAMKNIGLYYALVHGRLERVGYDGIKVSEKEGIFGSEPEKHLLYRDLIDTFDGDLSVEELRKKISLLHSKKYLLALSLDQIRSCPYSIVFYNLCDFSGEPVLAFNFHLGLNDKIALNKNRKINLFGKSLSVIAPEGSFLNYGGINFEKVLIRVKDFLNKNYISQLEYSGTEVDRFYDSSGNFDGADISGLDVEIVTVGKAGDLVNQGGRISGKQRVFLCSSQGNVENRALVFQNGLLPVSSLRPGFVYESGLKFEKKYFSGEISSKGLIKIVSESGKIFNLGSKIFAEDEVYLSGYLGVVFDTLVFKYLGRGYNYFSFGNFAKSKIELENVAKSEVSGGGNIKIISKAGKNLFWGSKLVAGNEIRFISKGSNEFLAKKFEKKEFYEESKLCLLGYSFEKVEIGILNNIVPQIQAPKIVVKSEFNNVFEAALMDAGHGKIFIEAGNSNIFKGAQKRRSEKKTNYKFGISFSKSVYTEGFSRLDYRRFLESVAAIQDFRVLPGGLKKVISVLEKNEKLIKNLVPLLSTVLEETSIGKYLGENSAVFNYLAHLKPMDFRRGLGFYFNFGLGYSENFRFMSEFDSFIMHAGETNIISAAETVFDEASLVKSDKVFLNVGGNLEVRSAGVQESSGSWSFFGGLEIFGFVFPSFIFVFRDNKGTVFNYRNSKIIGNDIVVSVVSDCNILGGVVKGRKVLINCKESLNLKSVLSNDSERLRGVFFDFWLKSFGSNFMVKNERKSFVLERSVLQGTDFLSVESKQLVLVGASVLSSCDRSIAKIDKIGYKNLPVTKDKSEFKFGLSLSLPQSFQGFQSVFSSFSIRKAFIKRDSKKEEVVAEVSKSVDIFCPDSTSSIGMSRVGNKRSYTKPCLNRVNR